MRDGAYLRFLQRVDERRGRGHVGNAPKHRQAGADDLRIRIVERAAQQADERARRRGDRRAPASPRCDASCVSERAASPTIASSDVAPDARDGGVGQRRDRSTGRRCRGRASGSTTSSASVATSETIALRRPSLVRVGDVDGAPAPGGALAERQRPAADPEPVTSRNRLAPAQVARTSTKAGTSRASTS